MFFILALNCCLKNPKISLFKLKKSKKHSSENKDTYLYVAMLYSKLNLKKKLRMLIVLRGVYLIDELLEED